MFKGTNGYNRLFLVFKKEVGQQLESTQFSQGLFHPTNKMVSEVKMAVLRQGAFACSLSNNSVDVIFKLFSFLLEQYCSSCLPVDSILRKNKKEDTVRFHQNDYSLPPFCRRVYVTMYHTMADTQYTINQHSFSFSCLKEKGNKREYLKVLISA